MKTNMKNLKNKITLIIMLFVVASCDINTTPSSDAVQQQRTAQLLNEADRQVGMPNIVNFQERKLAKMILELRDQENFLTYAYIVNMQGDLIFLGRALGYGLPYSVQFTNPLRVYHDRGANGSSATFIPQADPNGLFMPDGLSATWVMLVDPETNEPRPVYIEPQILISPFKLH
jgi:hypothetical protein